MATFVGEEHDISDTGTVNCQVPAGVQDGDVLIAAVFNNQASGAPDPPTGWTSLGTPPSTPFVGAAVFWRVASSEPGSYNWEVHSSEAGVCQLAFRDVDLVGGNPILTHAKGGAQDPPSTITAPEITTDSAATIVTFNATSKSDDVATLHSSADAGVEAADWSSISSQGNFSRSGAVYYKLDQNAGTYAYHIDLSGSSINSNSAWTVALRADKVTGSMGATATGAQMDVSGEVFPVEATVSVAAPVALLSLEAITNLVRAELAATSPSAVVTLLSDSNINGPVDIVAPPARPQLAGVHDVLASLDTQAPAPVMLMGAETRIFGARVVVVRPEVRVRYPF